MFKKLKIYKIFRKMLKNVLRMFKTFKKMLKKCLKNIKR